MKDQKPNDVTKRFLAVFERIKLEYGLKTNVDFSDRMGLSKQNLAAITTGKQNLTVDMINKLFTEFRISPLYLHSGIEPVFFSEKVFSPLTGNLVNKNIEKDVHLMANDPQEEYIKRVATDKVISIPITPISAAGSEGVINRENYEADDYVYLPQKLVEAGKHLCIQIKGDSMSPTLQEGGYVVVRMLDPAEWHKIAGEHVYVVVNKEGQTFIKRVKNRLEQGFIVLISDNPDKATYKNLHMNHDDIHAIWIVEWYLSAKMPNIYDQFSSKLSRLEGGLEDLTQEFERFKKRFEK